MYASMIALICGYLADLILGDPVYPWHPVRLIGNLISFLDSRIRKQCSERNHYQLAGGLLLVVLVCGISMLIPAIILLIAYRVHVLLGISFEAILCYQFLATKSLYSESKKVYDTLKFEGIEQGRKAVSKIVGRDTEQLDQEGVIKAAVETVAENTTDGIIAPIFYMIIGGAVLGAGYKAVNTMDSMIGYKNETYLYFGRIAAKLDDIMNYIPARLAAFTMIGATFFDRIYSTKEAARIYKRDRYHHASPNSAHTEAVMAGALGIKLAGDAFYFGKHYQKPTIGDALRPVEIEDIIRSNRLMIITSIMFLMLSVAFRTIIIMLMW